jgi:peptide deformylase
MADKSTSSDPVAAVKESTATATPAPARTIYPIVKYGDPVLEKPGAMVKTFDAELETLAEDMFVSMYAAQGVGLAAPQIGKSIRKSSMRKARHGKKKDACRFRDSAGT